MWLAQKDKKYRRLFIVLKMFLVVEIPVPCKRSSGGMSTRQCKGLLIPEMEMESLVGETLGSIPREQELILRKHGFGFRARQGRQ